MTMYLIDKAGALLGTCAQHVDGWRFIPNTTAHKASRKAWPSAVACIPAWAFDASDELLTLAEWKSRKVAA